MLGAKEWAFVVIQALIILVVIPSTFNILNRISDSMMRMRERRMQKKALKQFLMDVEAYKARSE